MRKNYLFSTIIALAVSVSAGAQSVVADPVLMNINGKVVTKSEFEYSFHKNANVEGAVEKKTVDEYVPMFINYKLKVAAAEAAKLDTLSSFKKEFHTYRDMQLTPYLVDTVFIDSIAHVVYNNTLKNLDGKDLIETSHILIQVNQKADEAEKAVAKAKADSIYMALQQGADFAELAKQFSGDRGSALKGGKLPMVGPGAFVKEFEDAAYSLQNGELSQPVLSPFGYHIIKMDNRKQLDSFEKVLPEIMAMLKRQNIEEASSEYKIKKLIEASQGKLTREMVLDSVMNANIVKNADLRYLIQEYHDGLLLYEISKKEVWDVVANDSVGLESWYKKNKKQYAWTEPRYKGYVYHCKDASQKKAVIKMLKQYTKNNSTEWRKELKKQFNKDSVLVAVSGPYLCKAGENAYVDAYAFKKVKKEDAKTMKGYAVSGVYGKVLKQPKSYLDVKPQVTSDYQAEKEKEWVENLRNRFTYSVNEDVLKTIK